MQNGAVANLKTAFGPPVGDGPPVVNHMHNEAFCLVL